VIVGEAHALRGQFVQVWRHSRHDALAVGADVKPANVVARNAENVRPLRAGACARALAMPPARMLDTITTRAAFRTPAPKSIDFLPSTSGSPRWEPCGEYRVCESPPSIGGVPLFSYRTVASVGYCYLGRKRDHGSRRPGSGFAPPPSPESAPLFLPSFTCNR
jgi:hypothetical protein